MVISQQQEGKEGREGGRTFKGSNYELDCDSSVCLRLQNVTHKLQLLSVLYLFMKNIQINCKDPDLNLFWKFANSNFVQFVLARKFK